MTFEAARIHFFGEVFAAVAVVPTIGTLRSDNGDVLKKSLKNRLRIILNFFAIIPIRPVT